MHYWILGTCKTCFTVCSERTGLGITKKSLDTGLSLQDAIRQQQSQLPLLKLKTIFKKL